MKRPLMLDDLPVEGKVVLLRVDFNVPLNKRGEIVDDSRIRAALPTIQYLLKKKAKVIVISHLGRPKGRDPALSLAPCLARLESLLAAHSFFIPEIRGEKVKKAIFELKGGELLMLENLRFEKGEEKPDLDPSFSEELAGLADFYVNDAFGAAHRAHASITEVAKKMQGRSAIGFLMKEEIDHLSALFKGMRPFIAIVGGAKVSTKMAVLRALAAEVDQLLIGGAMAYTFFKAKGYEVGDSPYEPLFEKEARRLVEEFPHIALPEDIVAADAFTKDAKSKLFLPKEGILPGWQGMDIGPQTIDKYKKILSSAKQVFWNGPLGVFEFPQFATGTLKIAQFLGSLDAYKVVGGGDSIAAISSLGLSSAFNYLSTGGGASLEFLEKRSLPGIEVLLI